MTTSSQALLNARVWTNLPAVVLMVRKDLLQVNGHMASAPSNFCLKVEKILSSLIGFEAYGKEKKMQLQQYHGERLQGRMLIELSVLDTSSVTWGQQWETTSSSILTSQSYCRRINVTLVLPTAVLELPVKRRSSS